jgi:hypothetical protein
MLTDSRETLIRGRYATCHRCQSVDVPVFCRDVFGMSRVELCRKCIADLDLGWPVDASDPEIVPRLPDAGRSTRVTVVMALVLAAWVVMGLTVLALAHRLGIN